MVCDSNELFTCSLSNRNGSVKKRQVEQANLIYIRFSTTIEKESAHCAPAFTF